MVAQRCIILAALRVRICSIFLECSRQSRLEFWIGEDKIHECDDLREEYKVVHTLWARWIFFE